MFDELKKKLYFAKLNLLYSRAVQNGKITEFDEEIFEKMGDTIIACLPVSLYIKYSNYLFVKGTCADRSLYMFLALEDAVLVRGDNKDLEYYYGKEHAGHGWVEIGDYVYDPSLMLKFDKNIYYTLYWCTKVCKTDKATYLKEHKDFVNTHVSHDFNEFRPHGKRRLELGSLITQIRALSKLLGDENFTKDVNDYLTKIEYDKKQIQDEREKAIQESLNSDEALATVDEKNL